MDDKTPDVQGAYGIRRDSTERATAITRDGEVVLRLADCDEAEVVKVVMHLNRQWARKLDGDHDAEMFRRGWMAGNADVQAQCAIEWPQTHCPTHGQAMLGVWRGRAICPIGMQAQIDAAVATAQEQLDAREKSSRNLAHYASHDDGFDAPMSGNDLVTRDALRVLRQAMEIALAERAKAQQALIYLAREAGGSPVATIELDRHGQEIRAALWKLHEHAERIARLTGFVSMRLGAECAGYDCVDIAIRFMESALDEEAAAGAKAAMKDRAFTDAEWATRYGAMCRERDRALSERPALCEKHRADKNWHDLKDCLACAVEELEGRVLTLDADLDAAVAREREVTRARIESRLNAYYDHQFYDEFDRVEWLLGSLQALAEDAKNDDEPPSMEGIAPGHTWERMPGRGWTLRKINS